MHSQPRFKFYQEAVVRTASKKLAHFDGKIGIILGRTEVEDEDTWYYTVALKDECVTHCFYECDLSATGRQFSREDFYSGESIRVRVDEKGRGRPIATDGENVQEE